MASRLLILHLPLHASKCKEMPRIACLTTQFSVYSLLIKTPVEKLNVVGFLCKVLDDSGDIAELPFLELGFPEYWIRILKDE